MWVCRAGKNSVYLNSFIETRRIYIPWDILDDDLSDFKISSEYRNYISKKMKTDNITSISNWAGQLKNFCLDMQVGDYVLIPHCCSRSYTLARITGDYQYKATLKNGLFHSRSIDILYNEIPSSIFAQNIRYSLGAYRTIFRVKDEQAVLGVIDNWKREQ